MTRRSVSLAEARRSVVRQCLPLELERDRAAHVLWADRGLTLAQRDRAIEELIATGAVRLDATRFGIRAEVVAEGEP